MNIDRQAAGPDGSTLVDVARRRAAENTHAEHLVLLGEDGGAESVSFARLLDGAGAV
ncbi:MAG: hypothetical protein GY711_11280, partial [bacterium]|nr:hypothetical protein [bacterium]